MSLADTVGQNRVDNVLVARKKDVSNQALIYEINVRFISRLVVVISIFFFFKIFLSRQGYPGLSAGSP